MRRPNGGFAWLSREKVQTEQQEVKTPSPLLCDWFHKSCQRHSQRRTTLGSTAPPRVSHQFPKLLASEFPPNSLADKSLSSTVGVPSISELYALARLHELVNLSCRALS